MFVILSQVLVCSDPNTRCSRKGHREELSHLLLVSPSLHFLLGLEEELIAKISHWEPWAPFCKATSSLSIWWGLRPPPWGEITQALVKTQGDV